MPSESISDRLAAYGITHEPGNAKGRLLSYKGKAFGYFHSDGAEVLLEALDSASGEKNGN